MKHEKYITEIKNGKYHYFRIQLTLEDGTRWNKNINVRDYGSAKIARTAAIMERDKALSELHVGKLIKTSPTVETLFTEALTAFGVTAKTQAKWKQAYQAIAPYGSTPIDKVTTADVNKSLVTYAQTHTQERVSRVKSVWSKIYKLAQMKDIPVPDRSQLVQLPKSNVVPKERKQVTISEDDFFTYIAYLEECAKYTREPVGMHRVPLIRFACLIMWYTGIRPQEVFALRRESVNLITRTIHIDRSVGSDATRTRVFKTTKTKQSIRDVPIVDDLMPVIIDLLQYVQTDDLFLDHDGLPFEIDQVSTYVGRTAKAAGVYYTMYMCRHTVSTKLFNSNVPQQVVRDVLGHASSSMSLHYAISTEEQKKEALNKLN